MSSIATTAASTTGLSGYDPNTLYPVAGKKEMDSQDFMKLFITQLQYQDPSKPMDTYQMSAQLSQFTSMEATVKMSSNIEKLLASQTSQNNLQLLTLLDKDVLANGNSIGIADGKVSAGEFDLADKVESCIIEVYNSSNQIVRQVDMKALDAGTYQFAWDGKGSPSILFPGGETAPDGFYTYKVKAKDFAGGDVDVESRMIAKVTGLSFKDGKATLTLNKQVEIGLNDIQEIQ
ncbi:MAG: hypothetical protein A2511_12035 [Deltaproteobacteria bacterium RIFOXYD12_FULL_50_9]|nr:MAG: hypothetical protein A2511_12035 [Deltaproteobacteria bacterium RIFOXYD12_FULL_50_9]